MKYKAYLVLKNNCYSERQGERYPLLRLDIPAYDSYEQALLHAITYCINTPKVFDDIVILAEPEVKHVKYDFYIDADVE